MKMCRYCRRIVERTARSDVARRRSVRNVAGLDAFERSMGQCHLISNPYTSAATAASCNADRPLIPAKQRSRLTAA
jgi:hypothetical protein